MQHKNLLFSLFVVFSVILFSCEKHPFDYRNKYLGRWDFKTNWSKVNVDSIGQSVYGNAYYFGEIDYGDSDNELIIRFMLDKEVTIEIDKTGRITNFGTTYGSGYFRGKDELSLYLRFGGLGGWEEYNITGTK
ncbi:MAG: hypothetical protein AB9842_08015 [Bacteroidales bacterium]